MNDRASTIVKFASMAVVALAILWSVTTCELDRQRWQSVDRAVERGATVVLQGEAVTVRPPSRIFEHENDLGPDATSALIRFSWAVLVLICTRFDWPPRNRPPCRVPLTNLLSVRWVFIVVRLIGHLAENLGAPPQSFGGSRIERTNLSARQGELGGGP